MHLCVVYLEDVGVDKVFWNPSWPHCLWNVLGDQVTVSLLFADQFLISRFDCIFQFQELNTEINREVVAFLQENF